MVLIAFTGCEKELYEDNLRNERPKINLKQKSLDELLKIPIFNDAFQKLAKTKSKIANKQSARTALEDQYDFTIVEDEPIKIITDQNGILYYTILIKREGEVDPLKFENLVMKIDDEETTAAIFKYTTSEPAKYLPELETYRMNITDTQSTDLVIDGKTFMANSNNPCFTSMTIMCFQHNSGCTPTEPHVATAFCMESNTCSTNYIYVDPGYVCLTGTLNSGGGGDTSSNPAGPSSNNNGNTGASANGGITLSPIGSDPTYTQIKNIIRSLSPQQQAWYNSQNNIIQTTISQFLINNNLFNGSTLVISQLINSNINNSIVNLTPYFKFPDNSNYENLYPRFTEYIKNKIPQLRNNSFIISKLVQYSELPQATIINDLQWGVGPTIQVVQLDDFCDTCDDETYGLFDSSNPNVLYVDIDIVNLIESSNNASQVDSLSFLLGVTILHEYVHLGDFVDGVDQPSEEGLLFEQATYGESIWINNAGTVLIKKT